MGNKVSNTRYRLKELMEERNLRPVDVLNLVRPVCQKYKVKLEKNNLSQYLSGTVNPGQDKTLVLAEALGVDVAWLMGLDVPMRNNNSSPSDEFEPYNPVVHKIPILGYIAAGLPLYADEHIEGYTYTERNGGAEYFALKVKGDSMINAGIHTGDIVLIKSCPDVDDGEIAAVLIDDEATLKRVYKLGDRVILRPENPAYSPMEFCKNDGKNIRILGKAVALQRGIR